MQTTSRNTQLFSEKVSNIDFKQIKIDRSKDLRIRFSTLSKDLVKKIIETTVEAKTDIYGIVYFTNFIDVTFNTRSLAIKFKGKLEQNLSTFPEVTNLFLLHSEDAIIYLKNVPIMLSNDVIKSYFTQFHGEIKNIVCRKDDDGYWTGERAVYVKKEVLKMYPIKSYIYIGSCEIFVKYRDQILTCRNCGLEGHTQKQCLNQRAQSNLKSASDNNYSFNRTDYPRLGKPNNTSQNNANEAHKENAPNQLLLNAIGLSVEELETVNALKTANVNSAPNPPNEPGINLFESITEIESDQLNINKQSTAIYSPVPSSKNNTNKQLTPFKLSSTTGGFTVAAREETINLEEEALNKSHHMKRSFTSTSSTEEMDRTRPPPMDPKKINWTEEKEDLQNVDSTQCHK